MGGSENVPKCAHVIYEWYLFFVANVEGIPRPHDIRVIDPLRLDQFTFATTFFGLFLIVSLEIDKRKHRKNNNWTSPELHIRI